MEIENQKQSNIPAKKSSKKKFIAAVVALLVLGGAGSYFLPDSFNIWSKLNISMSGNAAAVVNGEKILMEELDSRIEQAKDIIQNQGVNLEDEKALAEVKKQMLNDMISEKILLQNAEKGGFTATSAEVQTAYDQLAAQFKKEEDFQKELTARKVTEKEVKESLAKQMTLNKYIEQNVDLKSIGATEEEINTLYKNYSAQQKNMPELGEIKNQLADQVKQQKTRTMVFDFIEKLKTAANIKILL